MRKQDVQRWFFGKKAFLFDLDGTLYLGKRKIAGAVQLLQRLKTLQKKVFYVSNNSSRSVEDYVTKLNQMGFAAKEEQVLLSTHSLIRYLEARKLKRIFLLGTPAMKRMLESQSNLQCVNRRPERVVVGFDKTLTYQKLLEATRFLDQGVPLVVTHPDLFCPTEEGPEPDCGAIAALLCSATGRSPEVTLGKPSRWLIRELFAREKLLRRDLVMVGDRLATDIRMAADNQIESLLVLSGDSQRKDLRTSKWKPTHILSSVADLLA